MEVLHPRCAGLDVSKKDAKVCVRAVPEGRVRAVEETTTWSAMTADILQLREHLVAAQVTCVVMESTGDYWKPFLLRAGGCPVRGDAGQCPARQEPARTQD
jgi:hypothetical protein